MKKIGKNSTSSKFGIGCIRWTCWNQNVSYWDVSQDLYFSIKCFFRFHVRVIYNSLQIFLHALLNRSLLHSNLWVLAHNIPFPHSNSVRTSNSIRAKLGWTFSYLTLFLSIPTLTRCYCLLECGKGLFLEEQSCLAWICVNLLLAPRMIEEDCLNEGISSNCYQ